ncbi:MAG: ligase-associated DNA damage response endonuclease PdeM [Planctomycetota bacterium]
MTQALSAPQAAPPEDCAIEFGGQRLVLMPERCVHWPEHNWLLAADLHWGKCQAFRDAGAPLPRGVLDADLAQLTAALARTGAARLVVLGDLIHARAALSEAIVDDVRRWRAETTVEIALVPGNHDRGLARTTGAKHWAIGERRLLDAWDIELLPPYVEVGSISLVHEPPRDPAAGPSAQCPVPSAHTIAGHLHPMLRLGGRQERLRLPAFWEQSRGDAAGSTLVLPAFSRFADGASIAPGEGDRLWVVAGRSVRGLGEV